MSPVDVPSARVDAAPRDGSPEAAAASRCAGPFAGWREIDVALGGDYERLVAAEGTDPRRGWLAAGGRAARREPIRVLHTEVDNGTPRVLASVTLATTEGSEPLALAVDATSFAVVARDAEGVARLARFAREGGAVMAATELTAVATPATNRVEADVAFGDDGDVIVVARRVGTDAYVVERRDPARLAVRWSERSDTARAFRLSRDGRALRTTAAIDAVEREGLRRVRELSTGAGAAWTMLGAARRSWIGYGRQGFALERDDGTSVVGPPPGSTFGTWGYLPAHESEIGALVAVNVDLVPAIGWFHASRLDWARAPRAGGSGAPHGDARTVGLFYLAIEIPRPEMPLRYWGCERPG